MFFSVKNPIKIGGKVYKPCICYEVTSYLKLTIDKLLSEDKVDVYEERVFFCNGKLVPKEEKKVKRTKKEKAKKILKEESEAVVEEKDVDSF